MVRVRKVFISQLDLNVLVMVLIQPPTDGGELICGDSLHDPYSTRLEAVLGQ
jgi:hypothetical protein